MVLPKMVGGRSVGRAGNLAAAPSSDGAVSITPPSSEGVMRPMLVYLSAYFTLIVVAGAVLWRAG